MLPFYLCHSALQQPGFNTVNKLVSELGVPVGITVTLLVFTLGLCGFLVRWFVTVQEKRIDQQLSYFHQELESISRTFDAKLETVIDYTKQQYQDLRADFKAAIEEFGNTRRVLEAALDKVQK